MTVLATRRCPSALALMPPKARLRLPVRAGVGQELRDVEADAPCADHGHSAAQRHTSADHVRVAVHVRAVHARDVRGTGGHASGQHDLVVPAIHQLGHGDLMRQVDLHARELELAAGA